MLRNTDNEPAPTIRPCPGCGADNSTGTALSYSWQHWKLQRCRQCQFVYLENPPDYSALTTTHAWETNRGDRRARMRDEFPLAERLSRTRRTVRRRLGRWTSPSDKLARWIAAWVPPGRVVDIGCGDGDRLVALPPGYTGVGIEISRELARRAEANLAGCGAKVVNAPAIDGLSGMKAGSATGIIMRSFLEHEHHPRLLLRQVARVLANGGAAIIKVPNFAAANRMVMGPRWCGFRFPGHLNYFTPRTLESMVKDANLTVARFHLLDRFPLSDNMWMVALSAPKDGSRGRRAQAAGTDMPREGSSPTHARPLGDRPRLSAQAPATRCPG